jgi:hypothetical protein
MHYGFLILVGLVILFTLLGTLLWGKKNPDGVFVACGDGVQIGWSDDGITWNASTHANGGLPFGVGGIAYTVVKDNDIWVAGGNPAGDRTRQILWSDDQGKTWHDSTGVQIGSVAGSYTYIIEYGGGKWVAGGTPDGTGLPSLVYSSDGKNWNTISQAVIPFGVETPVVSMISYLNGKWIAGGKWGIGLGTGPKMYYSGNGIDWFPSRTLDIGGHVFGVEDNDSPSSSVYGNGIYVSVGNQQNGNTIWLSYDTDTWFTPLVNPFSTSASVISIKFYGGMFVAVGIYASGGTISAWSDDGLTWTIGTGFGTLTTNMYLDTIIPPSKNTKRWFVGGGIGGTGYYGLGYYSENGKDWTSITDTIFLDGNFNFLASGWSGRQSDSTQRTIAVGYSSDDQNIYYSDDRISWTLADGVFETGNDVLQVRYG